MPVTVCDTQFRDALAAYNRGDYAKAYQLWKSMAEKGDARAQEDEGDVAPIIPLPDSSPPK